MLIIEILLYIFIVIFLRIGRRMCNNIFYYSIVCVLFILGIIYCGLFSDWNLFTIPGLLLYISIWLYPLTKKKYEFCKPFWISIATTLIAFIITGTIHASGLEKCETPDVETTSYLIPFAKDTLSDNIWYIESPHGSVYKFYYQLEDGESKPYSIPANNTKLYFIQEGEEPHFEIITTTTYYLNKYEKSTTQRQKTSETTYKLYVPYNSIKNAFTSYVE